MPYVKLISLLSYLRVVFIMSAFSAVADIIVAFQMVKAIKVVD